MNGSSRTSHKLRFRIGGCLEMHAAQTSLALVERNVALNHVRVQPMGFEFPPAEGTCKESAMVFVHFRLAHERPLQLGFCKNQHSPAALRICLISFSLAARRPSR